MASARYPSSAAARDRFVIDRRPARPAIDPSRSGGVIVEREPDAAGRVTRGATVFLTGRECPWRCVMCDLWRHTTVTDTPLGAVPAQIAAARHETRQAAPLGWMKLYNAGSFFDPRAVPEPDYDEAAAALAGVPHVIVESHPALIGDRTSRWIEALARQARAGRTASTLEVAMGLETAHPAALERLNKRMTLDRFARAADWLAHAGVMLRAFLLVSPPFVPAADQEAWLGRSVDAALACDAGVITLIATRPGNGALEALAADGLFAPATLADLERGLDLAFARRTPGTRMFADLWDIDRLIGCPLCFEARRARLDRMNLTQQAQPPVACGQCAPRVC